MKFRLRVLLLIVACLTAAQLTFAQSESERTPHDGSPSGAVVAGLQDAMEGLGLKDADLATFYSNYQSTMGPTINKMGFPAKKLLRGDDSKSGIWIFLKWGFIGAIIGGVFATLFAMKSGNVRITDFGWSLAKAFIGILVIHWPAIIYILVIIPSIWLSNLITQSYAGKTGPVDVLLATSMEDGSRAAAARATATISAINDEKSLAMLVQAYNGVSEAVLTPNERSRYGIQKISFPVYEVVEVEDPETKEKVKKKGTEFTQSYGLVTDRINWDKRQTLGTTGYVKLSSIPDIGLMLGWTPEQTTQVKEALAPAIRNLVSSWPIWLSTRRDTLKGEELYELRKSSLEKLKVVDGEDYDKVLNNAANETYRIIDTALLRDILYRENHIGMIDQARKVGSPETANILAKYKEASWGFGFGWLHKLLSAFFINKFVWALGWLWLAAVDVMMINLIFTMPFWVHPKTEGAGLKAIKGLFALAVIAPLYIIALFITHAIYNFIFSIDGVFSFLKVFLSITSMIAPPLVAIWMTILFYRAALKGASLVGGMMKLGLSSVMASVAMAVPAVRGLTMAGAALETKRANDAESHASSETDPEKRKALENRAKRYRSSARLLTFGEKNLGEAFGIDEKYMDQSKSLSQNFLGGTVAAGAAFRHSIVAAAKGTGGSGVISGISKDGQLIDRNKSELAGVRPAGEESTDRLVGAIEALGRTLSEQTAPSSNTANAPIQTPVQPGQTREVKSVETKVESSQLETVTQIGGAVDNAKEISVLMNQNSMFGSPESRSSNQDAPQQAPSVSIPKAPSRYR